jgi:hypothetical protein
MVSLFELVMLITLTPTFITEPAPITLTRALMLDCALSDKDIDPAGPEVLPVVAVLIGTVTGVDVFSKTVGTWSFGLNTSRERSTLK